MRAVITESLLGLAAPINTLTLDPENANRGDVPAIQRSLNVFGQRKPVVVRRTGQDADGRPTGIVVAGNHTLMAATELGWDHVAAVFIDDDASTAKAYALADNRTGELSTWDNDQLAATLRELDADAYDMTALGWTNDELAALLNAGPLPVDTDGGEDEGDAPDTTPPPDPITRPGDVWQVGPHRIICGDCRDFATVETLLDGARINVAFTSPPYAEQRTYDESSGFKPIPPGEYVDWFRDVAANVRAAIADDGSWFVNIKPAVTPDGLDTDLYVHDLVAAHVRQWGWHFATELCWQRTGVPKSVTRRFKNQFEPVYQFTAGDWKMRPDDVRYPSDSVPVNVGPGGGNTSWGAGQGAGGAIENARKRTNGSSARSSIQGTNADVGLFVVEGMAYPGNRLPTFAGSHEATGHTAAFPVGLPAFFIKAYSDPGDVIYDPFTGSGSTLVAAQQNGRAGYGCEISPGYVDVALRRLQKASGIVPVLVSTGLAHDFLDQDLAAEVAS